MAFRTPISTVIPYNPSPFSPPMLGRQSRGQPTPFSDLLVARDAFVAGSIHGLQVTYEFAGQVWVDTLLREPEGARLLRMPVEGAP